MDKDAEEVTGNKDGSDIGGGKRTSEWGSERSDE
jgi:hypothetical protein